MNYTPSTSSVDAFYPNCAGGTCSPAQMSGMNFSASYSGNQPGGNNQQAQAPNFAYSGNAASQNGNAIYPSNLLANQYYGYPAAPGLAQLFPGGYPEAIPVSFSPENLQYLNGFLRSQIGRKVTVELLVGTNTLTERTGVLVGVGVNYILLNEIETEDIVACDFYNIKFVHFYL